MKVSNNPIIKLALSVLLPLIVLLAFYTQAHGEEGPGGGFQAGAIMASALAAVSMTQYSAMMLGILRILGSLGVAIYVVTGIIPIIHGGRFLEHSVMIPGMPGNKIGIFAVEIGVGLAVFSVFSMIMAVFLNKAGDVE